MDVALLFVDEFKGEYIWDGDHTDVRVTIAHRVALEATALPTGGTRLRLAAGHGCAHIEALRFVVCHINHHLGRFGLSEEAWAESDEPDPETSAAAASLTTRAQAVPGVARNIWRLVDSAPEAAIDEARAAMASLSGGEDWDQLSDVVGALVDASAAVGDLATVEEAVGELRTIAANHPDTQGANYQLGTALSELGVRRQRSTGGLYGPDTAATLKEARVHLRRAAQELLVAGDADRARQAAINHGNTLASTCRIYEALDAYHDANWLFPEDPLSHAWTAKIVLQHQQTDTDDPRAAHDLAAAHWHARAAKVLLITSGPQPVPDAALEAIMALPVDQAPLGRLVQTDDDYERFIAVNRLHLGRAFYTPTGLPAHEWDSAGIYRSAAVPWATAPDLADCWQALRDDYVAAREAAFDAVTDPRSVGRAAAGLRASIRTSHGLLDQIAVALNSVLGLDVPLHRVHFHSLFHRSKETHELRDAVATALTTGGHDLAALVYMADDFRDAVDEGPSGALHDYRMLRNRSTHQFVTGTLCQGGPDGLGGAASESGICDLFGAAVQSLRTSRAALLHFLGTTHSVGVPRDLVICG